MVEDGAKLMRGDKNLATARTWKEDSNWLGGCEMVVAGMLMLLVLFMVSTILLIVSEGVTSSNWPTTKGVVTASGVEKHICYENEVCYCPSVSYEYIVNGNSYRSDRIGTIKVCGDSPGASRSAASYPIGRQVDVRYAPDNPAHALLENEVHFDDLLFRAVMVALGALFLGRAFWGRLKRRPDQRGGYDAT